MIIHNITLAFLILLLFPCLDTYGQKIRYKDFKSDISTKHYKQTIESPKYSPVIAGVCNSILLSSGYFYVGEPIRGAFVLGSGLVTSSTFIYGLIMTMSTEQGGRALMFSGVAATGLLIIWSVFDVVKIAKVKNLAYHDTNVSLSVGPDLFRINQGGGRNIAAYGLRFVINF